jgi:hypothetical protein
MSAEPLAGYLNDHLAGAAAGITLMDDRAERTAQQHAALEAKRLAAAREAFGTVPAERG